MKKLILSELLLLFLATTFITDSLPPGWYQQTLPVNDQINDLFFIDSLNGWVVTNGTSFSNDTAYIMHTTDGGNNWVVQFNQPLKLNAMQFLNLNTGYIAGGNGTGTGRVLKTTDSGLNWFPVSIFSQLFDDLYFVNVNTGWICDAGSGFGGLYHTSDGGINWEQQLGASFTPSRLFFLNKDTGWAVCNGTRIYRTNNNGANWSQIYIMANGANDLFFVNRDTGWAIGGPGNGIMRSTNGGFNWDTVNTPPVLGNPKIFFVKNKIGWSGCAFNKVISTRDGYNWGYQTAPTGSYFSIQFVDTSKGWAGYTGLIHTTDGGGPINAIQQISNEVPADYKLYQNYPNPFNPVTNIKYQISKSKNVQLKVYDITGRNIVTLVSGKQSPGAYQVDFSGHGLSSGVYFYRLFIDDKAVDTKKMVLLK